jgi:hydroxymethylpyrimidine kinase/phosphomethylpyrimidine kinase/thiamine-phosphate diphosphorylase
MLPSAGVVKVLCESIRKFPGKGMLYCCERMMKAYYANSVIYLLWLTFLKAALVVDPVMVSTSGHTLSGPSTLATYRYRINFCMHLWVLVGLLLLLHHQFHSTYGHALAIVMSRDELFSMADIVTPNLKEASKLLGDVSLHTIFDMRNAAESIYKLGLKYVFSISVNLSFSCIWCYICMEECQPELPIFYMNLLIISSKQTCYHSCHNLGITGSLHP